MAFSIKDYDILNEIGRGGFGTVFLARQKSLNRNVAIKILTASRSQSKDDIMRFQREAQALATLTHDNIVSVIDYAYQQGSYYLVMEFVDGTTFESALDKKIAFQPALYIVEKIVLALRSAHRHNIIHRDVKPGNILLGKQGTIKLADFGLAALRDQSNQYSSMDCAVGTLQYMAPESMVSPKEVDYRVDIFSLGCILYQVIAGTIPFPGNSIPEVSYRILNEPPPTPPPHRVCTALDALTMRSLSKDRDERPSLDELLDAIRAHLHDNYHQTPDSLEKFLNHQSSTSVKKIIKHDKQKSDVPSQKIHSRFSRLTIPLVSLAIIFALTGIGLFTYEIFFTPKKQSLPRLNFQQPMTHPNQPLSQQTDTPEPMVSGDIEIVDGTLDLRGMKNGDTLFIDGKRSSIRGAKRHKISLNPGTHRLEIHAADGRFWEKEIEIMPYQRELWDLRHERH